MYYAFFAQTSKRPTALFNALAYQACFRDVTNRSIPITKEVIDHAKKQLIAQRDTHLDSLIDKLNEERVRRVIDTIIIGEVIKPIYVEDDIQYTIDLGLVSTKTGNFVIANPIYQEIIPAVLAYKFQKSIVEEASWYENSDGFLNVSKLLESFTQFFRENADVWLSDFNYKESGPHILMLAFLQRVINGGGDIHREYALGRKRVDLLITWKKQKFVIELKIKRGEDTLKHGLEQTAEYRDLRGAHEGHLIIFDRDLAKSWEEKISHEALTVHSTKVYVCTM